jgi:hypothetical protein
MGKPHVTARVPRDHWHAVRATARANDVLPSDVIREILAQWVLTGANVRADILADSASETAVMAARFRPVTKPVYQGKQKAEPTEKLQEIDRQRKTYGPADSFQD